MLRRDRWIVGGGLFLICVLSWWYLAAGAGTGMQPGGASPMSMRDPAGWDASRWIVMSLMWWIMMIAMMVPSAAPMVLLYARVYRKGQESGRLTAPVVPTAAFAAGYLVAWLAFSLLAVLLHFLLERGGLVHGMAMSSNSRILSGALLLVAGAYQLSPWKNRCLAHCRSPAAFLSSHWRRSAAGAVRMGIDHGLWCAGCCWSLMLLLFVGGVMNLGWIAGLAVIVLGEKLLPFGRWFAAGTGLALVASGIWWLARAAR